MYIRARTFELHFHSCKSRKQIFLSGGSESPEEFPAGPLALVGWWDQRETQETFHTSIKTYPFPRSSGPAVHLSQRPSCPNPGLSPELRMGGLFETQRPVSALPDWRLCCLWDFRPVAHPSSQLHAWASWVLMVPEVAPWLRRVALRACCGLLHQTGLNRNHQSAT